MTKKRILVTGASSPLGQAVGRYLQKGGYAALGTVRNQEKSANLGMFQEIYPLNFSNPFDEISLGESVDAIIHVAAESYGTPEQMMTINAIGTYRLASAAIASGIPKFVYVSSTSVYGSTPTSELRSNSRIVHQSAYGVSKWSAECYLYSLSEQISCLCVRSPAIVGAQNNPHFLQRVRNHMQSGEPRVTASHPDFLFNNVIHEDTMAEFLVQLAVTSTDRFRAFPVGSLQDVSLRELLYFMSDASGYTGRIVWSEEADAPFSICLDDALNLGFRPLTALESIRRWARAWNHFIK